MNYFIIFIYLTIFISFSGYGQIKVKNLDMDKNLDAWYNQTVGTDKQLIQAGQYYKFENQSHKHHQFYKSMKWDMGNLVIKNHQYEGIELLYNTYRDILVIQNKVYLNSGYFAIQPNQQYVQEFTAHGHKFVNYYDSTSSAEGAGFYHQIYGGTSIDFIAKRKKKELIRDNAIQYEKVDELFLYYQAQFIKLKNKRTLYKLFPDLKPALKQYQKQHLRQTDYTKEDFLKELIQHCDKLVSK